MPGHREETPTPSTSRSSELAELTRLRPLLAANRSIVSELSLSAVLRRIVEAAREMVRADYAALGVIGPDGTLEQFIHSGMDEQTATTIGHLPLGRGVLGALIEQPEPIRLHSIADDPRSSGFPAGHPQMQAFLGFPISTRGEVFGNLYLTNRRGGATFSAQDEEVVAALAATASIAIDNARLYEESRRRQEWLRASAEIARDLLGTDALHSILVRIADSVRRLASADLVTLVVPAGNGELRVEVARGMHADRLSGFRYAAAGSLAGIAIGEGRARMYDPEREDEQFFIHLRQAFDVGPVMACPLTGEAGVRGAIMVGRRLGGAPFNSSDLDMAEAFADFAAVGLELADRRADQLRLTTLEDRHRIARDLHDHVIQRLFAAGLNLQVAVSQSTEPQVGERLHRSVDDIDETIRQIRSTIFELNENPATRRTATPRTTLLGIVAEVEPALGFAPELTFDGPVDTLVDDALLRDVSAVVREALTNVAKHAAATRAKTVVRVDPFQVHIVVADNGTTDPTSDRRSGLVNLQERAARRRGTCSITHGPEGATLTWTAQLVK